MPAKPSIVFAHGIRADGSSVSIATSFREHVGMTPTSIRREI
jgi:hypothetical protein